MYACESKRLISVRIEIFLQSRFTHTSLKGSFNLAPKTATNSRFYLTMFGPAHFSLFCLTRWVLLSQVHNEHLFFGYFQTSNVLLHVICHHLKKGKITFKLYGFTAISWGSWKVVTVQGNWMGLACFPWLVSKSPQLWFRQNRWDCWTCQRVPQGKPQGSKEGKCLPPSECEKLS